MEVLVTAASRYGSTAGIAGAIGAELRAHGLTVAVTAPDQVGELAGFDAVILGSAVYTGHWLPAAMDLAKRVGVELPGRPVWLFSSGPVGDPARKMVQKMGADPVDLPAVRNATAARDHQMFAGRLDRQNLHGVQKAALLLFGSIEGDFRDWDRIRSWARSIAEQLQAMQPATEVRGSTT